MTDSYDTLKAMLESQGTLSAEDIQKVVAEKGEMTPDEMIQLESDKAEKDKSRATVTMDDYLAALKVLDSAEEGSDEYKKAEAIVDKYESGG